LSLTLLAILVLALVFVGPMLANAQSTAPVGVIGHYRGFSQSIGNPNIRTAVELLVDRQDRSDFFGHLTMGPLPFTFAGKIDSLGKVKGRGTGPAGDVTFTGNFQDLGEKAALVLATYKFTPATGPVDQGNVDLIRNFQPPPDQDTPPIGGRWRGTSRSDLGQSQSTLELLITQDGTGFGGQEVVDAGTSQELRFDFVGTLDGRGTFVVIGVGAAGRFIVGGALNRLQITTPRRAICSGSRTAAWTSARSR
jgi:hypothetical protein